MLKFWKQEIELQEIEQFENSCWIEVTDPSSDEISYLSKEFTLPEEMLQDVLDIDERSRSEYDLDWYLIILRIPLKNDPDDDIPFSTIPLGIIYKDNVCITICRHNNEVIKEIKRLILNGKLVLSDRSSFVFQTFLQATKIYLRYLKALNIQRMIVEKSLETSTRNKELHKLLDITKCLVYFITSLKSNEFLVSRLQTAKFFQLNPPDEDLVEDVVIEHKQAIEMTNIYNAILSGMMDAFASIISNNLNVVMKRLTSITIVLMIPTLIASFYGMNLDNYFNHQPHGFAIVVIGSVLSSVIGLFFLRRQNWF